MNILLFGITREIVGSSAVEISLDPDVRTVADLKLLLIKKYPKLEGLRSLAVAIDKEYAEDGQLLEEGLEIALIPPVSGG
jgi:molybdopterin converting factor subunit 1